MRLLRPIFCTCSASLLVVILSSLTLSSVLGAGSGALYTWGRGVNGQLGHGTRDGESAPKMVEALQTKKVIVAACGVVHMAAITDDGAVYTWGDDRYVTSAQACTAWSAPRHAASNLLPALCALRSPTLAHFSQFWPMWAQPFRKQCVSALCDVCASCCGHAG